MNGRKRRGVLAIDVNATLVPRPATSHHIGSRQAPTDLPAVDQTGHAGIPHGVEPGWADPSVERPTLSAWFVAESLCYDLPGLD